MHPPLQNPRHLLNTKVPLETIAFGISLITMMATPRISQLHKLSIICLQVATTGISGKPPARKIIMNASISAKSPASAWKKATTPGTSRLTCLPVCSLPAWKASPVHLLYSLIHYIKIYRYTSAALSCCPTPRKKIYSYSLCCIIHLIQNLRDTQLSSGLLNCVLLISINITMQPLCLY